MTQPNNHRAAAELLATIKTAGGTANTIAWAQAYATLAVADELSALRAAVTDMTTAVRGLDAGDGSLGRIASRLGAMANPQL
jgi:hypothetical protein